MRPKILVGMLVMLLSASGAAAQGPAGPAPGTSTPGAAGHSSLMAPALKVFLDCKDWTPCFQDYLKTELDYVDYVTVREAADVHVLVTTLHTGSGGREFTLKFVGLGVFQGIDNELLFAALPTDTEELARRAFARTLALGLVRYALHTELGRDLVVTHRPQQAGAPASGSRSGRDPWNYWVFRTRVNGNVESEAAGSSRSYNGMVSANRTTAGWKFGVSGFKDHRENEYTFSDGESYTSVRRGYDATGQVVKSLSRRWSAGGKAFISGSTFENKDRVLNASAAIEFNVFPYTESTRRQLTFQYVAGVTAFDYIDVTVYDKLRETVGSHIARASFDLKQTWGSLSADLDYVQYMHDSSLNRKTAALEADVRLFRGFSLTVNARTSGIHDQLYLPKGNASDEEVLARQRQLATSFRHSLRIGFSYTFGSVFSNVVNTRLSNLVGGGDFR